MLRKISAKELQFLRGCSYDTAKKELRSIKDAIEKSFVTVLDLAAYERQPPETIQRLLKG